MSVQQADSTAVKATAAQADTVREQPAAEAVARPYEALKELPPDATPAQKDSVIKAVFYPDTTKTASPADTTGQPAHDRQAGPVSVELPQYYKENFFSKDSLFYSETAENRYGVAGDPVPYSIRGDNTMTALLICCFIITLVSIAGTRGFMLRQVKHFFRKPSDSTAEYSATTAEARFQVFLALQTSLLLALASFIYTLECVADTFVLPSQYHLVAIFFGIYAAYFAVKSAASHMVNSIFFGKKKSIKWFKASLTAISAEGLALFPAVLLMAFFDLSIQKAAIYVIFVIVLAKLSLFYKSFVMFFKGKPFYLQIILYFCALEMVPLISLWGILVQVVDFLKINF